MVPEEGSDRPVCPGRLDPVVDGQSLIVVAAGRSAVGGQLVRDLYPFG